MGASDAVVGDAFAIVPYVPRLTIEWLRDEPERTWRELDGTLAFVDISGFTAMSERLAALGKAGAEEVTDVMNSTFAALLEAERELSLQRRDLHRRIDATRAELAAMRHSITVEQA